LTTSDAKTADDHDPLADLAPGLLNLSLLLAEGTTPLPDLAVHALDLTCAVTGAQWASVTRRESPKARPRTLVANSPRATQLDEHQYAAGEGPCLAAIVEDRVVISEFSDGSRWPAFAARVAADGLSGASVSYPLSLAGHAGDSLNLYAETPHAFGDDLLNRVAVAASALAVTLTAIREHQQRDNLHVALHSNRRIGAAIGVLMARRGLTYDQAFDVLRGVSQRTHRKLRDLADDVLFTGTID
jgi:hypothetical protein